MEMLFGTHVREYGQHVGTLAGFEIDAASRSVRKIIFSSDGELGNHVMMRPFASVLAEAGEIDIRPYTPPEESGESGGVVVGHLVRIKRGGREIGHVAGLDIAVGTGELDAIVGRRNWWTRRF